MKLQNLTVIFIIIIIPIILLVSLYITTGLRTIKYQSMYDEGLLNATHDAIYAFELNIAKNEYSANPETKRNILKSSVKMFERSLANTCNISTYNTDAIEEYIPAIVFGMHDGFYMYAPSYLESTGKYEHNLKNYVYYSEELDNDGTVIIYSLDNYVTVSGYFNGKYQIKEGYLIDINDIDENQIKKFDLKKDDDEFIFKYKGIPIDKNDTSAIKYYKEAYYFSKWFADNVADKADYLNIGETINGQKNDTENENSAFVQHKREIIKNKIEEVLNSSITAYSKRIWGQNYKMPKLSEEDWQKIYSNISMITFFQGKNIGLTKYNGYCVLNSTNSNEYVNPDLMYFVDQTSTYHDIRCNQKSGDLLGYRIGDFEKVILEKTDDQGNVTKSYEYSHKDLACYECINGSLDTNETVQEYIAKANTNEEIKTAYWTSLARERYNTPKQVNTAHVITYELNGLTADYDSIIVAAGDLYKTKIRANSLVNTIPKEITIIMGEEVLKGGYTYNDFNGEIEIANVTGNVKIEATAIVDTNNNVSATNAKEVTIENGETKVEIEVNIDQARRVRVFKFTPSETKQYAFYSADVNATSTSHDPYAYLYDATNSSISVEKLDEMFLKFSNSDITNNSAGAINNSYFMKDLEVVTYDDDSGSLHGQKPYNFYMTSECTAGKTYYLVVRSWNLQTVTNFTPIYIQKIN